MTDAHIKYHPRSKNKVSIQNMDNSIRPHLLIFELISLVLPHQATQSAEFECAFQNHSSVNLSTGVTEC